MKKYILILILSLATVGVYFAMNNNQESRILKVGIPGPWKDLVPTLQHTAYADHIMHNQFEPLVVMGRNGVAQPLAAKSWSISEDNRTFTFEIDTSKRFSNGDFLTAQHFKNAWEYSLTIDSKSANNSLLDVLYKLEGFDLYKENGEISGLRVVDNGTLQIRFKNPFRMALAHLSGTRVAAFVKNGDDFFGTGPYVINELDSEHLILHRSPFSSEATPFEAVEISVVKAPDSEEALRSGAIDLYTFAEVGQTRSCSEPNMACVSGSENRHFSLIMNGKPDRFFSDVRFRKALQFLIMKDLSKEDLPEIDRLKTEIDSQIYIPLQAGRLEEDEARGIVNEGEEYLQAFIKETKKRPLVFAFSEANEWLKELLVKKGVHISDQSPKIESPQLVEMYYKTHEPDLLPIYTSVANGDPDGIYHVLGRNGSISSPMIHREKVSELLEAGRKILKQEEIALHYQEVSRTFLREVPFVHMGFVKGVVIMNKDRVEIGQGHLNREAGRYVDFRPL